MKVTFLGAGVFSEALAGLAIENGHEIKYYDPYKFPEVSLSDAIDKADVAIYVAPANAAKDILPNLPEDLPIICASKGFISLKPFEKFKDFTALGGAAFADDIKNGQDHLERHIILTSSSVVAESLFTSDFLHVEHSDDTKGIMLCGSLKNVFAIGAGLYIFDETHNDEKQSEMQNEAYFYKAYTEIQDFLSENECNPDTAMLSCGLADLFLTSSPDSRNFRFGVEIREHPESKIEPAGTVEGVTVIESLEDYPDFIIPKTAELFKDIVKKVKNATE